MKKPASLLVGFLGTTTLCVACSGSGGGGSLPPSQGTQSMSAATVTASPTASPSPFPTYPGYIHLYQGAVIGKAAMFQPTRGDAWPGTSAGSAGQPVDGLSCYPTMTENQFHIHAFVGVLVNGVQYAVPDSIGMNGWGPLYNGFVNAAYCFYQLHTHDASGMVHNEAASTTPNSGTMFTFGEFLDIWDHQLSGNGLSNGTAPLTGITRVFVAARPPVNTQYVAGYVENTDPSTWGQIPFYTHTAIWIEIGPPYVEAANLPKIRYYTEY